MTKTVTKIASSNGSEYKLKKIRKRQFIINLTKTKQLCNK